MSAKTPLQRCLPVPQWGWCGPVERAAEFAQAGLDYIEVQIVPLQLENDAAFANALTKVSDLPLPANAMSYLFPHDFRLVVPQGEKVDESRIRRYFDRVVQLLTSARSSIVVLGSGWTRNIPQGENLEHTQHQFMTALAWFADALKGTWITLVIEPLNRKESNYINSVVEGVNVAKLLNRQEIFGLADFYHMDEEHESLDVLSIHNPHAAWVKHIHLADTGRFNPGTGQYPYAQFMQHLKSSGYQGLMSCECGIKADVSGDQIAAMQHSLAFLKQSWLAA